MENQQLTLNLSDRISRRHSSLLSCISAAVHREPNGPTNWAGRLNVKLSNLSAMLAGARALSVERFEKMLDKGLDHEPIMYPIDKYLRDERYDREALLKRSERLLDDLAGVVAELKAGR